MGLEDIEIMFYMPNLPKTMSELTASMKIQDIAKTP